MFLSVLSIELSKIFSKGRSYIGFGAITILVPIVQAAMYSEGEAYFSLFTQGLQQQFSFTGTFLNGYLIAFIVLQSLLVHVLIDYSLQDPSLVISSYWPNIALLNYIPLVLFYGCQFFPWE